MSSPFRIKPGSALHTWWCSYGRDLLFLARKAGAFVLAALLAAGAVYFAHSFWQSINAR